MDIQSLAPTTTGHHPGRIQRFLELLHPGGETYEIRVLHQGGGPVSRFFTDPSEAIPFIMGCDAKGIYTPLNPIASPPASGSTKAVDITRRHWVLIDFDPKRDKGTNATADELLAATTTRELVDSFLKEAGFSEPLRVLSGNGAHLLYRVDLPAETDLVKRLVHGIAERYSTDRVDVDKNVHDAPRITKIAGTLTKKGEHTDERPQRVSVLENPGLQPHVTTEAVIRRYVASITPKTEPPPTPRSPRAAITLPQLQPIQTGCRFLQHCENSAATLSETDWFAMSSIVSLCEDGDEHMHRLSRPYPGYTEAETSLKIARAREHGKPHTCEQIESNGFAGCASCPHRGRITSPLQLGRGNALPYETTDLGNAELFADTFGDTLRCPTWERFLDEVFAGPDGQPRHDLIRYVQKAAGYSATGSTQEQCFFIA